LDGALRHEQNEILLDGRGGNIGKSDCQPMQRLAQEHANDMARRSS
jgi:hypothetical protein